MADGGEGTLAVLQGALGGQLHDVATVDPLGRPITAPYLRLPDGTAVVELAAASGIEHIPPPQRTPDWALRASTFGTGVLLAAALDDGARRVFLALGGSATTDGGYGLLMALGAHAYDAAGQLLDPTDASALERVVAVETGGARARLREAQLWLAVDVDNPLCGPEGAAAVYGPQKGLCGDSIARRDQSLSKWAAVLRRACGIRSPTEEEAGMGAAGGAGFPLRLLANARVRRGADWAAEVYDLDRRIRAADLVLTGEGRTDSQSASGKVPSRVARAAREAGIPCLVVSGALGPGAERMLDLGVAGLYAASPRGATTDEIKANAEQWLEAATARAVRDWLDAIH
jgi:glycerate kinase